MLHLSTLLLACKFGYCVVAHQRNAQIFLKLGRVLFYVDVSVLTDTFLHQGSILSCQSSIFMFASVQSTVFSDLFLIFKSCYLTDFSDDSGSEYCADAWYRLKGLCHASHDMFDTII